MPDNENLLNTQELEDSVSIDNLTQSPDLDGDDVVVLVHENNGVKSTYKAILRSIANFINKLLHYSTDLHTQNDTIIGAINELADGGGGSADITTLIDTPSSIQTFVDGGDNTPLKSCEVEITATQSGSSTPAPNNPRQISGFNAVDVFVSNKNLCEITESSTTGDVNFTMNDDGTVSVSGSVSTGNKNADIGHFILPAGTYTMSGIPDSLIDDVSRKAAIVLCKDAYSGSVNIIKTIYSNVNPTDSFTLTEATNCYMRIYVYSAAGTLSNVVFSPQIEKGEDATSFIKHQGTTHAIPLGQTIYGGTADVVGGNGVKDYGYILLNGTESWSEYPQQNGFSVNLTDSVADSTDMLCNLFPIVSTVANFGLRLTQSQLRFCHITDNISGVTDLATWKTWLSNNNVQVVYPLATATAFSFTETNIPTLSGVNNIYADCGNLQSLEYFNAGADDIDSLIDLETREFKKGKKVKFDITASHPNNPTAYSIVVKVAGNSVFSKAYTCNTYGVFAETTDYFVYDGEIYTVVAQGFQANTNQKMLTFAINDESYEVKCSASNSSYATEDSFSLKVGEGVDASDVYYDNSTSGLTATNLQDAIDEIVSMMQ